MYYIYADGVCIHHPQSPDQDVKVITPKLKMSDNAAGSLTFSLPPNNVGYSTIKRLTTEIVVKRDNVELWSGRVIDETKDFWNNRKLTCEGELGYLNDTSQPPAEYHNISVRGFLETLINIHNQKNSSDPKRQFTVGIVTVTDPNDSLYRYTNFESTLDCIIDKMVERLGGHLRIRKENGIRYIDYLADYPNHNTQTIEFGKNLIDFTTNWDMTDLATVIVPLGCNVTELGQESSISALEEYLTVESVNNGSVYVQSQEAVNEYGWIETIVHWDDVHTPNNLLTKAKKYLEEIQFEKMVLELSAVDMHFFDINTEAIDILDEIRCVSPPHGMDKSFPITQIDIPLDEPDGTTYVLGSKEVSNRGISASIRSTNEAIKTSIESLASSSYVLEKARSNAGMLINQVTNGYIQTIVREDDYGAHSEELRIHNDQDYEHSTKYWRWNVNGLGYYDLTRRDEGYDENNPVLSLVGEGGEIIADSIKVGILGDQAGINFWNMQTGEFQLSASTKVGNSTIASTSAVSSSINSYDSGLTQTKIFNRLTNNGQTQGIYLERDGKLYINAEYIKAGIITDNAGKSSWNLTTGKFVTTDGEFSGIIRSGNTSSSYTEINNGVVYNQKNNSVYSKLESGTLYMSTSNWTSTATKEIQINPDGIKVYTAQNGGFSQLTTRFDFSSSGSIGIDAYDSYGSYAGGLYISSGGVQLSYRNGTLYMSNDEITLSNGNLGNISLTNRGLSSYGINNKAGFDFADGNDFWIHGRDIHLDTAWEGGIFIKGSIYPGDNGGEPGWSGWFSENSGGYLRDHNGKTYDLKFVNGVLVSVNSWWQ